MNEKELSQAKMFLDLFQDPNQDASKNKLQPDIQGSIFDFAFGGALRDATLQKAFPGNKQELIESEQMKNVKQIVRGYINNLLAHKYKNGKSHTDAYFELTKKIRKELTGAFDDFVFGNIQKLVNMTVKYIYVACYAKEGIREDFRYCHCPMDRIMIRTVRDDYVDTFVGKKAKRLIIGGKWVTWSEISWSKIGENSERETTSTPGKIDKTSIEVYWQFQYMVAKLSLLKGINPIEYDFLYWKRDDDE